MFNNANICRLPLMPEYWIYCLDYANPWTNNYASHLSVSLGRGPGAGACTTHHHRRGSEPWSDGGRADTGTGARQSYTAVGSVVYGADGGLGSARTAGVSAHIPAWPRIMPSSWNSGVCRIMPHRPSDRSIHLALRF